MRDSDNASAEFECPLTLEVIGDAVGMSMVHVSRTLQAQRAANLVLRRNRRVRILDVARL